MDHLPGWTAYSDDPSDLRSEREWREGGPRLGRIDVRVGNGTGQEGGVVWLLSDSAVIDLNIRRENDAAVVRTLGIPSRNLAWWNEAGQFSGVVVTVATWAAAGVVGGTVFGALKGIAKALRKRRSRGEADPFPVMTVKQAEALARWVVCAEFHHDCNCVDTGRGSEDAKYDWSTVDADDPDERLIRPSYEFAMVMRSARFDGQKWFVLLEKIADGETSPEEEYRVEGLKGPSFFTSITWRSHAREP